MFAPTTPRRRRRRVLRVGVVLVLLLAVGEALRGGLDEPALAALERLAAWVGLPLGEGDGVGGDPSRGPVLSEIVEPDALEGSVGPERAGDRPEAGGPADAGMLSLETRPRGWAYVDGEYLGLTPLVEVKLSPGYHTLRVERDGFKGYSTAVTVAAGRALTLPEVVLAPDGS